MTNKKNFNLVVPESRREELKSMYSNYSLKGKCPDYVTCPSYWEGVCNGCLESGHCPFHNIPSER